MNEITINVHQTVATIATNFEEVKEELASITKAYEGLIYSDDTMSSAKSDVATLRKIKKAIEDKRKEVKKENAIPYEEFEKGCKELVKMIDDVINPIDKQIKDYQEEKKLKKKQEIVLLWDEINQEKWLLLADVWKDSWLNASVNLKTIREEMQEFIANKLLDIKTIMSTESEYAKQGVAYYKEHGDMAGAIRKIQEMERQKIAIAEELKRQTEEAKKQEELKRQEEETKKQEEEAKKAEEEAKKVEEEAKKVEEVVEEPVMAEPIVEGFEIETSSDVDIQGFDVTPAYKATCHVTVEDENMASILKEFLNNYDFKYTWEE